MNQYLTCITKLMLGGRDLGVLEDCSWFLCMNLPQSALLSKTEKLKNAFGEERAETAIISMNATQELC